MYKVQLMIDSFTGQAFDVSLFNPLSANPTKWSNTQTVRRQQLPNCLSVSDHFVALAFKGRIYSAEWILITW